MQGYKWQPRPDQSLPFSLHSQSGSPLIAAPIPLSRLPQAVPAVWALLWLKEAAAPSLYLGGPADAGTGRKQTGSPGRRAGAGQGALGTAFLASPGFCASLPPRVSAINTGCSLGAGHILDSEPGSLHIRWERAGGLCNLWALDQCMLSMTPTTLGIGQCLSQAKLGDPGDLICA